MLWFFLALATAVLSSGTNIFYKKAVAEVDPFFATFIVRLISGGFSLALLMWTGIPEVSTKGWLLLACVLPLSFLANVLVGFAIKTSSLSVVTPMNSLTPLFMLFTSPLLIGEQLPPLALWGVLAIVFGSYVLNLKEMDKGLFHPFIALGKDKGARLMIVAALVWSVTSNADKIGVQLFTPVAWAATLNISIALCMLPFALYRRYKSAEKGKILILPLSAAGVMSGLSVLSQTTAVSLTLVTYVVAIKRTGVLFDILADRYIFKEKYLLQKAVGAAIMVIGVLLLLV